MPNTPARPSPAGRFDPASRRPANRLRQAPATAAAIAWGLVALAGCSSTPEPSPTTDPGPSTPTADPGPSPTESPVPEPTSVQVIAAASKDLVQPTLQLCASWPSAAALREPSPGEVSDTRQEILYNQAKRMFGLPVDESGAGLRLDADGRLYLIAGEGLVSAELGTDAFPMVSALVPRSGAVPTETAGLPELVAGLLSEAAGQDTSNWALHPKVRGESGDVCATAPVARDGLGMQFPYVYAYASESHLLVVFQQAPETNMGGH